MADDWLSSAVDGLSLENGGDAAPAAAGEPSLSSNISQLLKSTRRDRADLESRLAQLRGFIQQTDEVMRGILESGDPTLAAKYSHLAGTRRSLEQNAAHLQDLLQKVAESEARARQLAERGRQLEAEEAAGGDGAEAAGPAATPPERPDHEQKVAVVRGRPGPGATRKRDAAEVDSLRAAVMHNWGSLERAAPRGRSLSQEDQEDGELMAPHSLERFFRELRGQAAPAPARAAPPPPPPPPLLGAEAALRDKAAELDATRHKLQQLRQLMAAVQDARQTGAPPAEAPSQLRALLGEVEAALDAAEEEEPPERGDRSCDDCGGRGAAASGPHSLPHSLASAGVPRTPARPDRAPGREAAQQRGRRPVEVPAPPRPPSVDRIERPVRAASLGPPLAAGRPEPNGPLPEEEVREVRAQLQHVTALVQALTRQPWPPQQPQQPLWQGVYPAAPLTPGLQFPGWYPPQHVPPPPPPDAQHQQTLSALSQCFRLLQSQQQQILEMQRQVQSTAAAVASASQPVTPVPPPPHPPPFLAPGLLRVDEPPSIELPDGFPAQSGSMLNNQVAPGSRANNYWDNFRSYSRQNLLSGGSEPEGERPRGDSESQDEPRAEGFMARPRAKKQKVNKENQQLERAAINTRPAAAAEAARPRAHRASTPQNNPQVDAIYSCVTALIAQNQEQPEFLIELLHDLQLVRTERQRQQVLLAVQSVVVQEVSGARHKQRNRGAAAAAAAPPAAGHHALIAAEREEIKTHLVNKHTKNLSHSLRPDGADGGAHSDLEDTTARNLAPRQNAATKNTVKQKTFEPPPPPPAAAPAAASGGGPPGPPLDDPELQLARLLHEMNVFLSDHQSALLSPVLLARLERLLLRACAQGRAAPPPPGLNQQLEQAMVPFMGQPVSEASGRLVQAVLERLGAFLRGRELLPSPPAAEPAALPPQGLDSESEEDDRTAEPLDKRIDRAEMDQTGHQLLATTDDGPQTIPEQEVPCLNGREQPPPPPPADRRTSDLSDSAATYRSLGTPRDTPEPAAPPGHDCQEAAETDA